jgi:hypothetical protein
MTSDLAGVTCFAELGLVKHLTVGMLLLSFPVLVFQIL